MAALAFPGTGTPTIVGANRALLDGGDILSDPSSTTTKSSLWVQTMSDVDSRRVPLILFRSNPPEPSPHSSCLFS
ncbi:uncharacterized protein N7529_010540 [Penicillium soppii]|uniref:uncharacterized protein n=1 Tax=Penicillium soppii TaxID=69789 RepID=UPI002547A3C5|nr:uncharacterized protein N7529_010540 [Penicillium soppii]KAJ5856596.1 hypothetical protein N7529_010540 [Penicillium soppii]